MKKLIPVILSVLVSACSTHRTGLTRSEGFVGVYEAEHVIDTIERISLRPDGRFAFEFIAIFGPGSGYEGRWEARGTSIVLFARDDRGVEVEFPLAILWRQHGLALIYTQESYATAPAKMLLPNSYRQTSKTPNKALEPTPGLSCLLLRRSPASPVVAHL